jgi:hypothetical protein
MTLIAGMKCKEGVIVAADTEHTNGMIRFQESKLNIYPSARQMSCHLSQLTESPYRAVVVGAGFSDYIKMTADVIRDGIEAGDHSLEQMTQTVVSAVRQTHEEIFRYWNPDDPNRPTVALFVGLRSGESTRLLRAADIAVSEVEGMSFSGSGESIAQYLARGLYRRRYSAAIVLNILVQIFRAVKESGIYVGGNTELCVLGKGTIFHVPGESQSYLWGLQGKLHRAIRTALDDPRGSDQRVEHWIQELSESLRRVRQERNRSPDTPFSDWITMEGAVELGDDPLEDVW